MHMHPVAKKAMIGAAVVIISAAIIMLVVSLMHRARNGEAD